MTAERITQQKTDMSFCMKADYLARQATYAKPWKQIKLYC